MTPEEKEEFRLAIQTDIKEAIHENLGAYKIPKEQHYIDHLFISDLREWQSSVKNTAMKAIIGAIVVAVGSLLFWGFLFRTGGK